MTADTVKIVGQVDKSNKIRQALKIYIMKDREKQRLEEEAEAEKTRKKKQEDEKKLKEETEIKATKDKLADLTKKHQRLQQEKTKVFEYLKKLISEPNKHSLPLEDVTRLYNIGLPVTHVNTVTQPVHPITVPATIIPRASTVSVNTQYKTSITTTMPVQAMPTQKRNRSPSPTVYRPTYSYKQAAGPHPFQKLEDSHRNHEYSRSYLYKPGSSAQTGGYSAFYSPGQNVAYTHPSATVHSNAAVYSTYSGRENVDVLHKSQPQSAPPPPTPPQHSSLYGPHRSSIQTVPTSSIQPANHVSYLVDHTKSSQPYAEDKYYITRPVGHVPVHGGVIPIQPSPQGNKHGSITSGYPIKPVATQIGSPAQLHLLPTHGSHHSSQSSHHSSQSSHHSTLQPHHPSLSSHHSPQTHHSSQQSQSHIQQSHHQQSSVHYSPSPSQLHHPQSQSSQQSHVLQQPPVSVQSHHPNQHHQQHIQQLHVQQHHPQSGSHHQLISHHPSPSIHHTSSQQHLQQAMHHQQAMQQSQSHHQSHSQQMHHPQMSQPHIQQHISSHQSQSQGQQSQQSPVVTSQAYANQMNAIQGGSRVVYSQSNMQH